ncbi:hypothetical protein Xszus_01532 [Xenorhabdus szentirmaii]|nr:hypothetical protein Xsze_02502 [Xenorhabdus szentirmaii DSM 16338]PHM41827.1 hypothetical protein Xszus_01532 [Xenorhabdus szentirmaii]
MFLGSVKLFDFRDINKLSLMVINNCEIWLSNLNIVREGKIKCRRTWLPIARHKQLPVA